MHPTSQLIHNRRREAAQRFDARMTLALSLAALAVAIAVPVVRFFS